MKRRSRAGALVALAVLGSLFVPGGARAAETFSVQVGQGFFEEGVPGFSARVYPGSIRVHSGDTIAFQDGVGLIPGGGYPQQWLSENWAQIDQDWFYFQSDPDDGENALKFNEAVFAPGTCGAADNPCRWSGKEDDLQVPQETEDRKMYVQVTAPPGATLWAASGPFSDINVNFKVEVVGEQEAASTQAELDARAAELLNKDREDAHALHNRLNAKRTFHITDSGAKVYDIWVGGVGGPIELLASYPRKITVPRGARVQYHFQTEIEPHTATFGGPKAKEMLQTGIFPFCDPDGDEGPGPDTMPQFGEEGPVCPEGSVVEFDVDPRFAYETGDNVLKRNSDYENSGLKFPLYPDGSSFDMNPWTVRFPTQSNDKGFKYVCLIHGGFMGGRVVVK